MHLDMKLRIVKLVDELAAAGVVADTLSLASETAAQMGVHATHVDLGSERLFQHQDQIHAELTHPEYDRLEGTGAARPKSDAEARALAAPRCQAALRRPGVVLLVKIDSSVPPGKVRVSGKQPVAHEG